MITNRKSKLTRILAISLALLLALGAAPLGMLATVFAQTADTFTVTVVDGEGTALPIDDGTVTLTNAEDAGITDTADLTAGVATFNGFIDDSGITYNVEISAFGYEPLTDTITINEGDTNADVTGLVELPKYTITTSVESAPETGIITAGETVYSGETRDIVVTAADGYIIDSILINDDTFYKFTDVKAYTKTVKLENIDKDITVKATFIRETFNITTSVETAVETGTITASTKVDYDGSVDITVTAGKTDDMQYQIEKILVNGDEATGITNVDKHTISLTNIQKDYTIKAYFKVKEYTVKFTIGANGSVTVGEDLPILTPGGTVIARHNELLSFVVKANQDNGYHIGSVIVNTIEQISAPNNELVEFSKELGAIVQDYEISVTFAINTYKLTVTAGANGSVLLPDGGVIPVTYMAEYGSTPMFKIIPNEGYEIKEIRIDDKAISLDTDVNYTVVEIEDEDVYYYNHYYTFSAITDIASINVLFEIKPLITDEEKKYYSIDFYPASIIDPPVRSEFNDEGTRVFILKNDAYAKISPVAPYNKILVSTLTSNYRSNYERRITTIIPQNDISVREYKFDFKKDKELDIDNAPIKIIIDKTKPEIGTISTYDGTNQLISSNDWTNQLPVTVSVNASDEGGSGLQYVRYGTKQQCIDDTYESAATDYGKPEHERHAKLNDATGKWEFSFSYDQNTQWYVWAYDLAGNKSDYITTTVKIDTVKPQVTGFLFTKIESPKVENLISFLTFGTFFKETIQVIVSATDNAAGVKEIALFAGEGESPTLIDTKPVTGGTATFEIKATDFDGKIISAKATDNAGNITDAKKPSEVEATNTNAKSDSVMIEGVIPTIVIAPVADENNPVYSANDGKQWYAQDLGFEVTVADNTENVPNSGLRSVSIEINGTAILKDKSPTPQAINQNFSLGEIKNVGDPATAVSSKTFIINTDQATRAEDGSYTIVVKAVDNAGNEKTETRVVYKDTDNPEISGFSFKPVNDGQIASTINFLTFGVFCKEKIEVTVTASDTTPSAGINTITLFTGVGETKKEVATQTVNKNNQTTFKLLADQINVQDDKKVYFDEALSAVATDHVDNTTTTPVIPNTGNTENLESFQNRFMIETVPPTIGIEYLTAKYTNDNGTPNDKKDDKAWYEDNIDFEVTAKDEINGSGIRNVTIGINNNKDLVNQDFYEGTTATFEEKFVVNTDKATRKEDGSYTITVTVTDNAGNVFDDSRTVYKDIDAPVIKGFQFTSKNDLGFSESDGKPVEVRPGGPVEETDYGFYFREDTIVTVTARDDSPTSGLKNIAYYLDDIENKEDGKAENAEPLPVALKDENNPNIWTSTFTVPANFKGQIYAKATDNVNNTPEKFDYPNSAIVESPAKHQDETHITFVKVDTTFKDRNGLDLYAEDTNVTLKVTDTYSGLRKVEWSVVSPYDTENNQNGQFEINNDKTYKEGGNTDGWAQTPNEKDNLVMEMTKTITVKNDSNAIVVWVRITDRAGNTSEEQITFSIDKTAPVIEVKFDDAEKENLPKNLIYYKQSRTATVTVYERNFMVKNYDAEQPDFTKLMPENLFTEYKNAVIGEWSEPEENTVDPNNTKYTATVYFEDDGHYKFALESKDAAGNFTDGYALYENKDGVKADTKTQEFYVDKTPPVLFVDSFTGYYQNTLTTNLEITERNFHLDNVNPDVAIMNAKMRDGDTDMTAAFPNISSWSHNGDSRKASIGFNADARYEYSIRYADLAGNEPELKVLEWFVVDTKDPECKIIQPEDKKAYIGEVAPKIEFMDTNLSQYDYKLEKSILPIINTQGEELKKSDPNPPEEKPDMKDIGGQKELRKMTIAYKNFDETLDYDNVYTLTAIATDLSGRKSPEQKIVFSVNRWGAVYVYDDVTKGIINKYINQEKRVTITEINASSFVPETFSIKVASENGTAVIPESEKGYTFIENNMNEYKEKGEWFRAVYDIDESNFASNSATYTVLLSSIDEAGKENKNDGLDVNHQRPELSFTVDKEAPKVTVEGLESGGTYAVGKHKVTVTIEDNKSLENVQFLLMNEPVQPTRIDREDDPADPLDKLRTYEIEIEGTTYFAEEGFLKVNPQSLNLKVRPEDKAGNGNPIDITDFSVTKNLFVRWYRNIPLLIGSIAGVVIIAAAATTFIIIRKRRED